jgi:hypothetical protein
MAHLTLFELPCNVDEFCPGEALLHIAWHFSANVPQEVDFVMERERVGVVRQRELLARKVTA